MVMRGKKHWLSLVFEIGIVSEVPHKKVETASKASRYVDFKRSDLASVLF